MPSSPMRDGIDLGILSPQKKGKRKINIESGRAERAPVMNIEIMDTNHHPLLECVKFLKVHGVLHGIIAAAVREVAGVEPVVALDVV